jgi:hypothetical protein
MLPDEKTRLQIVMYNFKFWTVCTLYGVFAGELVSLYSADGFTLVSCCSCLCGTARLAALHSFPCFSLYVPMHAPFWARLYPISLFFNPTSAMVAHTCPVRGRPPTTVLVSRENGVTD